MNRRAFLQSMAAGGASLASAAGRPGLNFLFVLMDDMGWHDLRPYGNSFIDTPNVTRFASESARFTNAYAACPVCSPTRASILTGKYPARLHLTDWIPGRKQWPYARLLTPEFNHELPAEERTIAAAVGEKNYRTAAVGKWHLGGAGSLPTDHGFGLNVAGTEAGQPKTYFGPYELPNLSLAPGEFLTEKLTTAGADFIARKSPQPFFLYQAEFAVHLPLQARPSVIEKYRKRDTGGTDPTYCAMVESADDSFGRLLETVEGQGLADRTVVILFSDNGGLRFEGGNPKAVTNNAPLRAGKGHLYEGGIREPLLIRWPKVTRPGTVIEQPVCSADFFPTICRAAGVSPGTVDGVDIAPVLKGASLPERPLFWHYPHYSNQGGTPGGAVRLGDWKLIEFYEDGRLELFNLRDDPGERSNLAVREKGRGRKLAQLLADWRASVKASMPKPNPQYDPSRSDQHLAGTERPTPPV